MRRGLWLCAVPLAIALTGCKSDQKTNAQILTERFWTHLTLSTEAANDGDLEAARASLDEAAAIAFTAEQYRKVDSLENLYAGTEALMAGDANGASLAWAHIEDPALRNEVSRRAQAIGMSVPSEFPSSESEVNE